MEVNKVLDQTLSTTNSIRSRKQNLNLQKKLMMLKKKEQAFNEEIEKALNLYKTNIYINIVKVNFPFLFKTPKY